MANFTGQTVTNAGRNLLGRVLAGEGKLVFTKAAFGDQKHSGDLKNIRDLKHKKLDLKVMNIRNDSGTAVLTVYMSNENVEEGFRTEEFGVYAKIDTDDEEILYSYCVAIEADFFPNNRLGHTYENVTDVYMAIANDVDADIHVQDGVVFLTKRIADENYIKYGVQAVGELEGRTSLEENKRYSSKGEWYLNIGGNRSWDKSPTPDENLIPMTWDWLFKNKEPVFKKKSGFNLEKTDSYEENDTNKVATGRALKSLYDWIRNKLASFTLSWDRITNKPNLTTTENLTQLLKGKENTFAKNSGFNKEKTDDYNENDTNKLFTQKGANDLKKEIDEKQDKIDNTLETSNKTVSGAINEIAYRFLPKLITTHSNIRELKGSGNYYSNAYGAALSGIPEDLTHQNFYLQLATCDPDQVNNPDWKIYNLHSTYNKKSFIKYIADHNRESEWGEYITTLNNKYYGQYGMDKTAYVQDSIQKEKNKIYIDKVTGKPFRCKNTTMDTIVNQNFIDVSTKSVTDNIDGIGDYLCLSYNEVHNSGIELLVKPSSGDRRIRVRISSKGTYFINASSWFSTNDKKQGMLTKNGTNISQVPKYSAHFSDHQAGVSYVGIFDVNDEIEFTYTSHRDYDDFDNIFSIVKIKNLL